MLGEMARLKVEVEALKRQNNVMNMRIKRLQDANDLILDEVRKIKGDE